MKASAALLAIATVLLAGCSPAPIAELPDATASPTVSATSTLPALAPVPTPAAGTIVIAGSELLLYPADGTSMLAISYEENPAVFRVLLTDLFGYEPEFTHHDSEGDCDPSYDRYGWGQFGIVTNSTWIPDGYTVEVNTSVASQSGISIVSSLGVGVGDDFSAQRAHYPEFTTSALHEGHDYTDLYFDVTPSTFTGGDGEIYDGDMGVLLAAMDDVVYVVAAPVIVGAGSSC